MTQITIQCDHSPRARHFGVRSQVGLSITTNKASGGDEIPAKLFKILKKMMLLKCCTQYTSKFVKLSNGHRTEKGQFSFQSQRKAV